MNLEQRKAKIIELSAQYKCEVQDWTFENPKVGQVICFVIEPSIHLIYGAYDKMQISPSSAGEVLMEGVIIKGESDPRIFDTSKRANHEIILRYNIMCQNLIQISLDDVKKK
jgi:hypothetical protein